MQSIETIYRGAQKIIEAGIRKESRDQGHYLTGAMEESLDAENRKEKGADILEGVAVKYTEYVNQGLPKESASFKQFPFLVEYFKLRGLQEEEAKRAAAATIRVWQKEGMPTKASSRFSKNKKRQEMIEDAIKKVSERLNAYMSKSFDNAIHKEYIKEKSETI